MRTISKPSVTERLLTKRQVFFTDDLSEIELQLRSVKWHKMINRYQSFIGKIMLRQFKQANAISN